MSDALTEAIDMIEELVVQGCWWDGTNATPGSPETYCDMAISTYESACGYLAEKRPEMWMRTGYGMRQARNERAGAESVNPAREVEGHPGSHESEVSTLGS